LDVPPRADYDATVRPAVLDRRLRIRLNVEQTKDAMQREFLVTLFDGFVYDCLRGRPARLDLARHRRMVLERFSGTRVPGRPAPASTAHPDGLLLEPGTP
jgi:hypothetical protein